MARTRTGVLNDIWEQARQLQTALARVDPHMEAQETWSALDALEEAAFIDADRFEE